MHELGKIPLRLGDEVLTALAEQRAVVALETTLIVHGLPAPDNLAVAAQLEGAVRQAGATPATVGVLDGTAVVGLSSDEIARLAEAGAKAAKLSARDLGPAVASASDGATTVAGTIALAALAGIEVMATGGLGGVHRGAASTFDESADLVTLHETPVLVVSSGVKSILDVAATLERLETLGVPVIGYRTARFPGFYIAETGHELSWTVDSPGAAAAAFRAHRQLASGGMLVAQPVPKDAQLAPELHDAALAEALAEIEEQHISGKAVTPFLLAHLARATSGESVSVNRALVLANGRLAGEIAVELSKRAAS